MYCMQISIIKISRYTTVHFMRVVISATSWHRFWIICIFDIITWSVSKLYRKKHLFLFLDVIYTLSPNSPLKYCTFYQITLCHLYQWVVHVLVMHDWIAWFVRWPLLLLTALINAFPFVYVGYLFHHHYMPCCSSWYCKQKPDLCVLLCNKSSINSICISLKPICQNALVRSIGHLWCILKQTVTNTVTVLRDTHINEQFAFLWTY